MGWSERGEIRDSFKLKIEITSPTIFCRENVKLCKSQILCISKLFIACSFFCSILSSYWGGQFGQNNNKMQPSHENYLLSVCLLSSLVSILSAFVISVFIDGYPLFALFAIFLKKWANPGLFLVYFPSFQTNIDTIFTTNQCEKCPSSIWHRDSNPQPFDMSRHP